MSAHAFSEPYAYHHRRYHARFQSRQIPRETPRKSADVITLVPRDFTHDKQIELVYPQYKNLTGFLALGLIVALHLGTFGYFYLKPVPPITQAEVPPMTVELYRPPVEQPPAPVIPEELPPPPPKVEKPKPIEKPKPKSIKPKAEPVVQQVVETPAPVQPPPPITPATANPGYLRNPAPAYPEAAMERGWEGTVVLSVHVLGNGKSDNVELKQSSGRKILDTAAIQTVKRWSFVPARQGDLAIDSWVEVPIDFKLSNS